MQIIKIKANSNGSHDNQTLHGKLPIGYAIIPDDMDIPSTFPYVNIEVEGDMVVKMVEGIAPPEPPKPPTTDERLNELRTDVDNNADMTESISTEVIPELMEMLTTQAQIIEELMTNIIPSM